MKHRFDVALVVLEAAKDALGVDVTGMVNGEKLIEVLGQAIIMIAAAAPNPAELVRSIGEQLIATGSHFPQRVQRGSA